MQSLEVKYAALKMLTQFLEVIYENGEELDCGMQKKLWATEPALKNF